MCLALADLSKSISTHTCFIFQCFLILLVACNYTWSVFSVFGLLVVYVHVSMHAWCACVCVCVCVFLADLCMSISTRTWSVFSVFDFAHCLYVCVWCVCVFLALADSISKHFHSHMVRF